MRATKKTSKKHILEKKIMFRNKLVFFRNVVLYYTKLTGFFWKSAAIQCARWQIFFGNARLKSNARAHLKQRKNIVALSQQTRGVGPMLGWRWPIVYDAGPTSAQHWANASCLLGLYKIFGLPYCGSRDSVTLWIKSMCDSNVNYAIRIKNCCSGLLYTVS